MSRIRSPVTSRSNWANRQQHVQRQPAHARGCIERLGDADEADPVAVEQFDHAGKIGQRTGQPVDLVDHHHINLVSRDIGQQAFERRALHRTAGDPAVVIPRRKAAPAFAFLALDEGFAGFPLGVEAVELLVEPFLGAFAGIERAALLHWPDWRRPKNRGPFQRVPVMALAAADRLG